MFSKSIEIEAVFTKPENKNKWNVLFKLVLLADLF